MRASLEKFKTRAGALDRGGREAIECAMGARGDLAMLKIKRAAFLALGLAAVMHVMVAAQAPHAGPNTRPQPGPNTNVAGGIADPNDPAILTKVDIVLRQQNETVIGASTRNADHFLAAANDYRFVDFQTNEFYGGQTFIAKLLSPVMVLAKALGLTHPETAGDDEARKGKFGRPLPAGAAVSVGAWT